MSDFKAKMHQVRFWLRLNLPQTPLGELTALPRPPSWILEGRLAAGRGKGTGWGKERDEEGCEEDGRTEGKTGKGCREGKR